jgi:hypothetical protein
MALETEFVYGEDSHPQPCVFCDGPTHSRLRMPLISSTGAWCVLSMPCCPHDYLRTDLDYMQVAL